MAVLVTRPGEQGHELCSLLNHHGVKAIHHPLITINSMPDKVEWLQHLDKANIIIAISQHAVHYAEQILSNHNQSWPQQVIYLAVGQKTAHYLSMCTQQKVHYPHRFSDSEHLLQLTELKHVKKQNVLILRGNGGRELIKDELVKRGAAVHYGETYKRDLIPFDPARCLAMWKVQQVSQIVITSSEQLAYLCDPLTSEQLAWLNQQELYLPSQRVADLARQRGFSQIRCIGSASNQDLLTALTP
ncbi:uroporphyrinogen-III synthase [Vibrio azureus]|uniref:Uroporphyrinogen-III synthase n=1 Tax=Vibrio azureus NBRC 104587 TaxID=1219077 RepID=U3C955_9VIBR|nr:uroporphyrinogen-III synthase [Vibrio azureus]AUI87294.1 uroporphyrinogen-III synthase [Vibrio azureus]GAD77889.1 uroporphyrinogen-III synthase [Vibrio azureus NBRC 104587]